MPAIARKGLPLVGLTVANLVERGGATQLGLAADAAREGGDEPAGL